MFSRDVNHYRATPRSLAESKFGPYSKLSEPRRTPRVDVAVMLGVLILGACFGMLFFFGWGA